MDIAMFDAYAGGFILDLFDGFIGHFNISMFDGVTVADATAIL